MQGPRTHTAIVVLRECVIMENILSWTGIKARICEVAAHAMRAELADKSAYELTRLLEQDHLLTLKKQLIFEELKRHGITYMSIQHIAAEKNGKPDASARLMALPQTPTILYMHRATPIEDR
jgi:hypothetical protein